MSTSLKSETFMSGINNIFRFNVPCLCTELEKNIQDRIVDSYCSNEFSGIYLK